MTPLFFVGSLLAAADADAVSAATDKIWATRWKVTNLLEADDALSTIAARLDTIDTRNQDYEARWKIGLLNVNHRPTLRLRRRVLRKAREELLEAIVAEWDPSPVKDGEEDTVDWDKAPDEYAPTGAEADTTPENEWDKALEDEWDSSEDEDNPTYFSVDWSDDELVREDLAYGRP